MEALLEEIEIASYPYAPDRSLHESQVAAARAHLGEEAFETAWREGRAMTLDQAVEYALTEVPPTESTPRPEAVSTPTEAGILPELRVYALGQARVEREGRDLTPSEWTYAKARELLFYLISHPPRTREQIGLVIWPEASPSQLRKTFHNALYH